MIVRNDFNSESFDQLVRNELIEQMVSLEIDGVSEDATLLEAFRHVIAFNSVPGTYMEGAYDRS